MNIFHAHQSSAKRFLLALLGVILLGLALVTSYQFAASPTDENLFADAPSRVMVGTGAGVGEPGDLVVGIGAKRVMDLADIEFAIQASGSADSINTIVISTRTLRKYETTTAKAMLRSDQLVQLPPSVWVLNVTEGGASDRAGMMVGDIIYRINGKNFKNAQDADRTLRLGQTGRSTIYDVYRSATPLALNVVLARFGFPIANLLMSLAGLMYLCTGMFIAARRPELKAARLLGLVYMLMGYFLAVGLSRRGGEIDLFGVVRTSMWSIAGLLTFPLSVHVVEYFPRERRNIDKMKWVLRTGYGLVVAVILFFLFIRNDNVGALIAVGVMILYVTVAHILVRRDKQTVVKFGPGLHFASVLAGNTPLILLLGIIVNTPLVIGGIGVILFLVPIVMLYLVGRYRLLDLNIHVRRNVQYTLVSAVWGFILVTVLFQLAIMLVSTTITVPNIAVTGSSIEITDAAIPAKGEFRVGGEKLVLMVVAVVSWYGLWRVRRGGQALIDKKYFRTRYDYRRATNELAAVLASNLGMVELGLGIAEKLAELMHLKRSGVLFFRNEITCCCRQSWGMEQQAWDEFAMKVGDVLPGALKRFSNEFHAEYLPAGLKEIFQQYEFQYIVPIRSDTRLIGALVLGEKQSEASYGQDDLDFLSSAAKQSSVAIENAFLYEELAEQERMKQELQIARRIQLASLPQKTPEISGLDIAGVSFPAQEVGGDFFDYLPGTEESVTIVIGDVSGKGTSAALYMSKIQGILRSLHTFGLAPDDLLIGTNRLLCGDMEKSSFVTAMVARFDSSERNVTVARAGHLPLYHYDGATGKVGRIIPRGLGLGLNNDGLFSEEIEEKTLTYMKGDVFLFLSDGITEAKEQSGEEYGEDKVIRLLEKSAGLTAAEIANAVVGDVAQFAAGMAQHDDQTVVVVRIP